MSETFSYRAHKDGTVFVSFHGRPVTTLRKDSARRFLSRAASLDDEGRQQLMARVTGQFKHGNER